MGFENTAGINARNHYGPRKVDEKFGGEISSSGGVKEVEWVFSYDDLPGPTTGGEMETLVPKGAVILSARFQTITAFAGGTSYDIGLQQQDGTEIDNDGLWDALALAEINAENEWSDASTHAGTNSGNLVSTTVGLAANAYLKAVATGTFTAGKGRIVITYRDANYDASGRYTAGGTKA